MEQIMLQMLDWLNGSINSILSFACTQCPWGLNAARLKIGWISTVNGSCRLASNRGIGDSIPRKVRTREGFAHPLSVCAPLEITIILFESCEKWYALVVGGGPIVRVDDWAWCHSVGIMRLSPAMMIGVPSHGIIPRSPLRDPPTIWTPKWIYIKIYQKKNIFF